LGSRSPIFTIPFFRFFKKGEKYSKKTRLDFIFIFSPEVFAAIRLPTSRAAFICAAFAAPIPWIWQISVMEA
jgi:hypothetical protein